MDSSISHIVRSAFYASRPAIRSIRSPPLSKCPRATFCSINRKPHPDGSVQRELQARTYSSARKDLGRLILIRAEPHSLHPDNCHIRDPQRLFSRPASTQTSSSAQERTEVSVEQYNRVADAYLDDVQRVMEELQEEREDVDVEFSAGVLTVVFPPAGTYVINKQPPNKQIWLSSPVSGPKRYDYISTAEDKGSGEWVYLRDGTTMSALLEREIGVKL